MLRLAYITFSCDDPARVAEFWGQLLDYEATAAGDSWFATDPRGEGTRLLFNRMAKSPTIELPIHVDVNVPDREAEVARVLELGGHLVETKSHSLGDLQETWTVMRDPEGNGFCIQSPPKTRRIARSATSRSPAPSRGNWGGSGRTPSAGPTRRSTRVFYSSSVMPAWTSTSSPASTSHDRRTKAVRVFCFNAARSPGRRPIRSTSTSAPMIARPRSRGSHAAGASVVETKVGTNITFTVMRDPEGNPFCVG